MEKNKTTISLITFAVLFILGAVFISSIADTTLTTTQKTNVEDETFNLSALSCYTTGGQVNESNSACTLTVANAPTSWKTEDCPLTSVVVTNSTGTALTLTTDYVLTASSGTLAIQNTTTTNSTNLLGILKVDYSYCQDNYVNSSWGRSVLGINVGLFAVALLLAAAALLYMLFDLNKE